MTLDEFMETYFGEIEKINNFHFNYLITNKFTFPKHNYIELKRFIDTATNFLSDIDDTLLKGLTSKLYNDVHSLYTYCKMFKKKTEYDEYVFFNDYLMEVDKYKELKSKYELLKTEIENYNKTILDVEIKLKRFKEVPKNEKELTEYKKLKKQHVDSIYYISKIKDEYAQIRKSMIDLENYERKQFIPKFNKLREINLKKLEKIINVKLYYYEKLLWLKASESYEIRKFFEASNIDGGFSTKTFINYYLKNIDETKSSNGDWYSYLKKVLKVIE
ncbi:hypothetical protein NAMH_0164 [Nautilia profundicola AmH]|uniref:Uncharacterized protein n=1 Tax=Nautilia profundicola (strain ATCC BAA-1463 / DSM 18972 / AmH) TaxID=598659 RepID=B9L7I6_NAUPA|nr:hypothetical protein [Nautilia profundicola]ACM92532.1 hypothetical protein NAMH_0164 [Nautilia profundicola AmH]